MNKSQILRGVATISFYADDIAAAKAWYTELLGMEPYFQRPEEGPAAYIEFRIGDYQQELGIIDSKYMNKAAFRGTGGAIVFWHVDNLEASLARLIALGAKEYEAITERGAGFITASVIDPFGNILGIMSNPHYLEILKENKS